MSNPLLRPGDPRFQRPPLRDAAGNNVFADPDAPVPAEPADGQELPPGPRSANADNVFAPPTTTDPHQSVYQPRYETTHAQRGTLLLVLAIVGLVGDAVLLLIFSGSTIGIVGLASLIPSAIAFLLGREDLAAMRQGAVDLTGLSRTRIAVWLGLAGIAAYAAVLVISAVFLSFIVRQFS